ncbi:MAG TPA: glycoside hydrolase [Gammaproteobacteria bacterium]|nr:glycoside hydrolase [Gammaproteobacteria bacterium]
MRRSILTIAAALAAFSIGTACPAAQIQSRHTSGTYDQALFSQLHWRAIGPLRGGRMHALDAVPGNPPVFYAGADNGGIWKSSDYGRTWKPIFDKQSTGSIGSIAVAPSDPNIIYVGSGEGIIRPDGAIGNGMYKSTDAGKTWTHLGLRDTQKIARVIVDPHNPNRLFVAAMGHPYGPNKQRGIFRSTDGGKTFEKVLYIDAYTSGDDVDFDPSNPQILYATMWQQQQAPWESDSFGGTSGGIFKSTDGGDTWHRLTAGLPPKVSQVQLVVAPSDPARLYASVATGHDVYIYRSDDAGAHWRKITTDPRPAARVGGGDLPTLTVDPKNPDIVYSCTPVLWKSADGGKTWTGLRGGPGGDDYQRLWISPNNPKLLFAVVDQGTIISVNGGKSWSSWYNQPTAAMYDVATDNHYPYRVCGGDQDSGSACVLSRGNDGQITAHDWHPVGVIEYGRAAPDPLNPDIVYGGRVTRYNRKTGQIQYVGPPKGKNYRILRTMPLLFSPVDPHILYFASNVVWKTRDGGNHWTQISPDLTRKGHWKVPENVGKYAKTIKAKSKNRAVVYALAPSPLDINVIWAGTDDGLIQLTTDGGKHWQNVTPPKMKPWWSVYGMEASHFDRGTAYAAINTMQLDDQRPHLFRTRDFGKTWTEIDTGIPDGAATNVIIEDPKRQGLLFAGTETQVYVSFDDGDHWQSLRLNMPAISVRDLEVKANDLIAATHGRGFQILDDITPLRQIDARVAKSDVTLYKPELATRVRWGMNPPTPWRMPFMDNPPPGAVIDYYLGKDVQGPITLDILDADGNVVRHYSSDHPEKPIPLDELRVPAWWPRPPQHLSTTAGHHRYIWNMHYAPIPGLTRRLDADQAVRDNETPKVAMAPWVLPGAYTVRLTVNGHSYTQPLKVRMDPRVTASQADLKQQFDLAKRAYDETISGLKALGKIRDLQKQLDQRKAHSGPSTAIAAYQKQLTALAGPRDAGPYFFYSYDGPPIISGVAYKLRHLMGQVENADRAPTDGQAAAFRQASRSMQALLARWHKLKGKPLARLNAQLRNLNMKPLAIVARAPVPARWDEPWVKYYRADQ